jgi:3-hydroxyacyl-[acyl-carrier-protein] dehydratase
MMLNSDEIQRFLPHRYPFLFIDRVIELEPGKKAMAIKNVTINEWFFQGHTIAGHALMPGAIMIEAATQIVAVVLQTLEEFKDKGVPFRFGSVKEFRFYKEVIPGDTLKIEAQLMTREKRVFAFQVKESVEGNVVATGQIDAILLKQWAEK